MSASEWTELPPLVSVILTTRDRPRFLTQAFDCFRQSLYPNRELIVVDDGEVYPVEEAAVEAEGGLVTARIQLAEMLMARQDYEGADAQYLGILKVEPNNLVALNNLAFNLADHAGRAQDALPYAQRAYTIGGQATSVADTLGWVYHLLGDKEQAIKLLGPAANASDAGPEILLHAARAFQAAGRPEPARAYLDRALSAKPDLASAPQVQALQGALK